MAEYIEREAVIDLVNKGYLVSNTNYGSVTRIVRQIPAADVAPVRHGKWIIDREFGNDVMSGERMVICSSCNKGIFWGKQNYCPHCGARMDGEDHG